MRHEEIKDLLAAFALGAVSPDERAEVDRHLRGCDECRAEVADHEAVTNSLAMAVEPVPLPDGFRDRVVTTAIGERTVQDVEKLRRRLTRIGIAGVAALLVASIAIAGTVIQSNNEADRKDQVIALLQSGEGIALTGEPDITGRVVDDEFAIAGVETAPEGTTYMLWLMRGESCPSPDAAECELVPAGSFDTEDGVALVELDESAEEWDDAAVTVEEDEDVDFPTTTPFADSL